MWQSEDCLLRFRELQFIAVTNLPKGSNVFLHLLLMTIKIQDRKLERHQDNIPWRIIIGSPRKIAMENGWVAVVSEIMRASLNNGIYKLTSTFVLRKLGLCLIIINRVVILNFVFGCKFLIWQDFECSRCKSCLHMLMKSFASECKNFLCNFFLKV